MVMASQGSIDDAITIFRQTEKKVGPTAPVGGHTPVGLFSTEGVSDETINSLVDRGRRPQTQVAGTRWR